MLTVSQYERLPRIARAVVDADRAIPIGASRACHRHRVLSRPGPRPARDGRCGRPDLGSPDPWRRRHAVVMTSMKIVLALVIGMLMRLALRRTPEVAMSPRLPARFTIQRKSAPHSPRRYLAITDQGEAGWAGAEAPFVVFASEGAAKAYRRFRMGWHASDAVVVRHTIH